MTRRVAHSIRACPDREPHPGPEKDARGANMATLRDHLPVPRSMDLVNDFMERRRLIFSDRIRTQDPARKRRRAGDEQEPPEVMAA